MVEAASDTAEAGQASAEVGLAVVHPWLCDAMGHLATRHYAVLFEDASYQLMAEFAPAPEEDAAAGLGWADVRQEIAYHAEISSGALLRVTGRVLRIGRSSIDTELRIAARRDGRLHATMTGKTVRFDLAARKAVPIDDAIRATLAARFACEG
ncbi:acyl-CoA thioesterase [Sphingomonas canadensis]|uniref:Acyl-CoA thioesterase n=1 Tax=Sphingomonas canadensis TaxID=1219257 RepID=A0ABW3HFQ4_9SPHN|nr:thioesterase family protein [Sphingomonas canadensis]MCW3838109.1 thioesterase family protein [Sphingomonas canadensis]